MSSDTETRGFSRVLYQAARMKAVRDIDAGATLKLLADFSFAHVEDGVGESPRGSNRGKDISEIFKADDYKPKGADEGYPWCAAAVSFACQRWMELCFAAKRYFGHIPMPKTARAFGLSEWALGPAKGCVQIITPAMIRKKVVRPMPGDIAVFEFSHCGIVIAGTNDTFTCSEGNTDPAGGREGWRFAARARTPGETRHLLRMIPRALPVLTSAENDNTDHA